MKIKKYQSEKASYASFRVFEILKFLVKSPATIVEIAEYLDSLEQDKRYYSKTVVYKYLSTLKFAGIKIEKTGGKYCIKTLPTNIKFSNDELIALNILQKAGMIIPEKSLIDSLDKVLQEIQLRQSGSFVGELNSDVKQLFQRMSLSEKDKELFRELEKYCKDGQKLKIKHKTISGQIQDWICEPIEAIYKEGNIRLCVFDTHEYDFLELKKENILEITQLPNRNRGGCSSVTTIFRLKGKLAKRYVMRDEEKLVRVEDDGSLVVANRTEPKDVLIYRLIRYGDFCEILTPKAHRDKMKTLIKNILLNYEE